MPAVFGKITASVPCSICGDTIPEDGNAVARLEPDNNSPDERLWVAIVGHDACIVGTLLSELDELLGRVP